MKFISDLDKERYINFLSEKDHAFLQSLDWSNLKTDDKTSYLLIGIEDQNQLIGTSLVFKRKLFGKYNFFYSPRGPVIDFNNEKVLEFYTDNIKKLAKINNCVFYTTDPNIEYSENNIRIFEKLKYKYHGRTLNFETNQPRFTFIIDLNNSYNDIFKNFDTSVKQRIKKGSRYQYKITVDNNLKDFKNLMVKTEQRKGFFSHNLDFYDKFLNIRKDNAKVFTIYIDIYESINKINSCLEKENLPDNQKESLVNDLNKLDSFKERYYPVSSYIINYHNLTGEVLYGANNEDFLFTNLNYVLYDYHIKYALEKNYKYYDLFGCASKDSNNKSLFGLYEFKRKFGGSYFEYVGEFNLVFKKTINLFYWFLIPIVRKLRNKKTTK